jgi:hypothetical protein
LAAGQKKSTTYWPTQCCRRHFNPARRCARRRLHRSLSGTVASRRNARARSIHRRGMRCRFFSEGTDESTHPHPALPLEGGGVPVPPTPLPIRERAARSIGPGEGRRTGLADDRITHPHPDPLPARERGLLPWLSYASPWKGEACPFHDPKDMWPHPAVPGPRLVR